MGDWFQTVVDRDATEQQAPALGSTILDWLVLDGIVVADPTDCVLGSETGYCPGPHYEKAVTERYEGILRQRTNGLAIITKRTVFYSFQGPLELICSACDGRFEPPPEWGDALDDWYKKHGPGLLACPGCKGQRPIADWEHDPPWAFANLGFKFWNWPPISPEFIQAMATRLKHRVVLVAGKL